MPFDPNLSTRRTVALVEAAGLDVRIVKEYREGWSAGALLNSNPTIGSVVATGEAITLTVSSAAVTTDELRGAISLTPATPTPGQLVALSFAETNERDVVFSLAARAGQGWTIAYCLTSDGGMETGKPTWRKAGDNEGCGGDDIGIYGPGPDHVIIPDTAPDGNYRLCTANAIDEACSLLKIAK